MTVQDSLFARAARREPTQRTPVWFMRQAGRILPEYRAIREHHTLLEICRLPDLCADVTLQPVARMPLDAAVLFSDIMLPLHAIGVELEIVDEVGPVIRHPVRNERDLDALRPLEPEQDIPFVLATIAELGRRLAGRIPVIGFAGAPFTLAAYLVEGRPSRDFIMVKSMMYEAPALWHQLMERLTGIITRYLHAQAQAGAGALQLFDSWVGTLGPDDYATFVAPYTARIFAALRGTGLPLIHFGTGTGPLLPQMKDDGATVISVDWRVRLDEAWAAIGPQLGIQGNLDPAVLFAPPAYVRARVADVLARAAGRPGHIFNLGHGLHPRTPLAHVQRAVDDVRELSTAALGQHVRAPGDSA